MSFNIYASGTGAFNYHKTDQVDTDDFEHLQLLATLIETDGNAVRQRVQNLARDRLGGAISPDTPDRVGEALRGANLQAEQRLLFSFTMLDVDPSHYMINVMMHSSGSFEESASLTYNRRDTYRNASLFIKKIGPDLERLGFNNFAVVLKISQAILEYAFSDPPRIWQGLNRNMPSATRLLNITLSH